MPLGDKANEQYLYTLGSEVSMKHTRIVTEYLERSGLYPIADAEKEDGLIISLVKDILHLSGTPQDYIDNLH